VQEQQSDEYAVTNSRAANMLGLSRKSLYSLPLSYRQFKPRGRRYYRLSDIEKLKQTSIHQPNR